MNAPATVMRNFHKLHDLDIAALAAELAARPYAWQLDTFWKDFPGSMFREVDTIYLRFPDKEPYRVGYGDVETCHDEPAMKLFPEAAKMIVVIEQALMARKTGRVLINRLDPGARVLPHSDGERPPYSRYHLVVQTHDAVEFRCGTERATMKRGELWWFDNSLQHEVINHGTTPRIHMIMDAR